MYELDESKYLYLFFLLPFLVGLFLWNQFWKRKKQQEFGDSELVKKLSPEKSTFKPTLKFGILLFALILLILGLVNPKIGTQVEKVKREGIDIVFAIDVSKSMLCEDIAPSRLEKSKQLVSQIINGLGNDRIGIIAYSGSAFPVLPITTDYNAAKMFLQSMNPGMISSQGSNLDEAIQLTEKYFEGSGNTSKLLVMVTDGEDHSEKAQDAAAQARKKRIKIITIGVGTPNGGPIPIRNGHSIEYHKDKKTGETVTTKLRPEALESIAKTANGGYINGTNTKQVVDFMRKSLNNIQKTQFEATEMANFQSQFQWFLGIGFFLLLVDVFLLETKTKWIQKLDLFNEKSKK
ncbi:VWA domain-containing protein [Flavobacterium columnare]|uniref:VWA domain-containing protein n=1 Tax=Flavobacterium columnare TaxID=996 RepID=UPI0009817771|nr:VWA domain-containing protein [Flavobacterium columnare]MBF6651871.1 VWA domain-containing protein [Flavobacterium columnare]MBF6655472.1 VWA domain-containing protein [Flavobacterium columnare]MBF6658325.1 VWA domain-containing protein [Flavobacterium columnare]OOB83244.1 BatB protein [Flavobacterium columnare]PTD13809.1 VWA domain-containing protein [Flavobacterium columnare]